MVLVLSQAHKILIYHVNVQISIIPQLAMGLQMLKIWGHDSTRNGVGDLVKHLTLRVRPDVNRRTCEP